MALTNLTNSWTGILASSTTQKFTSAGSSGTYFTPANCLYIKVKMVGGGGGGTGAANNSVAPGSSGSASSFGTSLLTANGGSAGDSNGGAGGTGTVNAPAIGFVSNGGGGTGAFFNQSSGNAVGGGAGGSNPLGGGGGGGIGASGTGAGGVGTSGGFGSGGGGGGQSNTGTGRAGGGGGSGGYVEAIIMSPAASYAYTVGGAGGGGNGGTGPAGGGGGSGAIIVEEFYSLSVTSASSSATTTGVKNYITYGQFENAATTGWSLAHSNLSSLVPSSVATAGQAFSFSSGGSAASGNLALSVVSVNQLAGNDSLSLASSATSVAGDMLISQAYTIDIEDRAKVLSFKLYYETPIGASNLNFSGTSSNSYAIYIYDVANAAWIQPAGVYSMTQGTSTLAGIATGTFQTPSNMTSFQIALVNINASAGAFTIFLDDVSVSPQIIPIGPVITDWQQVTLSPTNFGSITNGSYWMKRVGDTAHFIGYFTGGTAGAGSALIGLPSGMAIDTSKIAGSLKDNLGTWEALTNSGSGLNFGSNNRIGAVTWNSGTGFVELSEGGLSNLYHDASANQASATSFSVSLRFSIPVVGWSSNLQMSNDTDTRVVAARRTGSSGSPTKNAETAMTYGSTDYDTHGGFSGNIYTVPVSGIYSFNAGLEIGGSLGANNGGTLLAKINGVQQAVIWQYVPGNDELGWNLSFDYKCNAGDTVQIFYNFGHNNTPSFGAGCWFTVARRSGPSVIAASEKVYLQYTNNGGGTPTANVTNIDWSTKVVDSHGAWNGTQFTAPRSGFYVVQGNLLFTTTRDTNIQLYINGVAKQVVDQSNGVGPSQSHLIQGAVYLNGGDQLSYRMQNTYQLSNNTTFHWISIFSQG